MCFQSSSLVELCDIFPSRINGKIFQFQGKISKAFIATTELTFGKFLEMFSPRFAFKLFKLRRQTYPFEAQRQGDKCTRQRPQPTETFPTMRHFSKFFMNINQELRNQLLKRTRFLFARLSTCKFRPHFLKKKIAYEAELRK